MRCIFLLVLAVSVGCSKAKREDSVSPDEQMRTDLKHLIEATLPWAETQDQGGIAVRVKEGSDGDALLFNAELCASGDKVACSVVKASQGPDGRMWRSPRRVGVEEVDAFSRDMLDGGLLGIAVTKDVDLMNRWGAYIRDTKRLCPKDSDSRCRLTPMSVMLWNYVADRVGGDKLPLSVVTASDPKPVGFAALPPTFDLALEALEPTTPSGFALHLVGIDLFIKTVLDDWNSTLQHVAERLVKRESKNAFFLYLKRGSDQEVGALVLELAPKTKPARTHQWSFERSDDGKSWENSCGWDFVFLASMILQ